MVQARLDAEGGDAKRVLRAAAVFGERFSRAGVAALLGGDGELGDVSRRDRSPGGARAGRARHDARRRRRTSEFTFAHALVREAAYAMLTDEDRALGPPTGRRAGWSRRGSATRWRWPSTSAAAASRRAPCAGTSARPREALRANDLGAAIERAEMGMASGAAAARRGAAAAHPGRGARLARRAGRGRASARWRRPRCWRRAAPPGCARRAQAIIAAGKHGRLDVVEQQVRLAGETARAAGRGRAQRADHLPGVGRQLPGVRRAHRRGRRADARGSPRRRSTPRRSSRRRLALVHQVRAARASAAGDLGRCLSGLESALQAFEQAGDLRNACAVRANLGYVYSRAGRLPARRGGAAAGAGARPTAWACTT